MKNFDEITAKWPNDTLDGILFWLGIFVAVGAISIVIFEIVRTRKRFQTVFYTRLLINNYQGCLKVPEGYFGWIKAVWHMKEPAMIEEIGLDAVMYLRYLSMCFKLFLSCLVLFYLFLIPVNALSYNNVSTQNITLENGKTIETTPNTLSALSINQIPDNSGLLWVHLLAICIVSLMTYYYLYFEYKKYVALYQSSLKNPKSEADNIQRRTILMDNLSPELSRKSKLAEWLSNLQIGSVIEINMNSGTEYRVLKLLNKHEALIRKLESAYMTWALNIYLALNKSSIVQKFVISTELLLMMHNQEMSIEDKINCEKIAKPCRPMFINQNSNGISFGRYDVINSIKYQIKNLEADIAAAKLCSPTAQNPSIQDTHQPRGLQKIYSDLGESCNSAFVTFDSIRSATLAQQLLLHSAMDSTTMKINEAPAPNDIIWSSLGRTLLDRIVVTNFIQLFSITICILWVIPTYYISTISVYLLSNEEWEEFLKSSPFVASLLRNVLPPVLVLITTSLMPFFLDFLSFLQVHYSRSKVHESTLSQYFLFLMLNVHFVFTFLSTAWLTSHEFFVRPLTWIEKVAYSFPAGSSFFINYLILNLAVFCLELLRPAPLLYFYLVKQFATTPRQFLALSNNTSYLNYGWLYPFHIMVFIIVICYSVISPIVILPGVVYFGIAWAVYKNQLMYVYVKQIEGKGRFWILAYNRSIIGVGIFQFLAGGILSAKGAHYQAIICGILIATTVWFDRFCKRCFSKHFVLPLESFSNQTHIICISPQETDPNILEIQNQKSNEGTESQQISTTEYYKSPSKSTRHLELMVPKYISHLIEKEDDENFDNIDLSIPNPYNWTSLFDLRKD